MNSTRAKPFSAEKGNTEKPFCRRKASWFVAVWKPSRIKRLGPTLGPPPTLQRGAGFGPSSHFSAGLCNSHTSDIV